MTDRVNDPHQHFENKFTPKPNIQGVVNKVASQQATPNRLGKKGKAVGR